MKFKKITSIPILRYDIEREALYKAHGLAKKGKLKRSRRVLDHYINIEELLNSFIKIEEPSSIDLNIMEEMIEILKIFYSNGKEIPDDELYDYALNKYKKYRPEPILEMLVVDRRTHDTEHEYPELKGTLEKCNKLFNVECSRELDADVESFIKKLVQATMGEVIRIRLSKKYDGSSVVMSIDKNGKITAFITRGEDGKGIDLSHLFKKLKFKGDIPRGVQFELIMTKEHFNEYCNEVGRQYANLRAAVTSIITSSKAAKYAKYLTPVPLNMSDDYSSNSSAKMNKLYSSNVKFDYKIIEGVGVSHIMKQISEYTTQMELNRDSMNYAIDGVVIDCLNPNIREKLGRKNDKNKFQVAYKFPPLRAITKITGFEITVGRTGQITPIIYYEWVDFNGTKHNHSSISSYDRFVKMNLHIGEEILLTYNGDVMPYPSKYNGEAGDKEIIFPKKCNCGSKLTLIGANYFCENPLCDFKLIPAYAFFYEQLGVRDFKESRIEKMVEAGVVHNYYDLLEPDYGKMESIDNFGPKLIASFEKQLTMIRGKKLPESKLVKALGILGETYAKEILSLMTIDEIYEDSHKLMTLEIHGIGDKIKTKFIKNLVLYKHIIEKIKTQINVVPLSVDDNKVQICFTGFRNKSLKELLEAVGFEVSDSFKKTCSYVITPEDNYVSKTTEKANKRKIPIPVLSLREFKDTVLKDMKVDL